MTKLRTMLYGAFALLASMALTTPAISDSSNFAGPYVGLEGSMVGVELDGEFVDPESVNTTSQGKVGMVSPMVGVTAGYNLPLGDRFHIAIGGSWSDGDASFDAKELANNKSVTIKVADFVEYYIEPSVSVTSNSAIYIKGGTIAGDMKVTGDDVQDQTLDLSGYVGAIGTKTVHDSGLFIKTEAGGIYFDPIRINKINDEGSGTTAHAAADPTVAYGKITIGFVF